MSYRGKPFSILRWINYKDGSIQKLREKLDYIADPKSSPEKFRKGYYINALSPIEGMETIHRRYSPVGKRSLKHGLISFGIPNISPEFAFTVSQELVDYFAKKYPTLLCLHTNIPSRIHAHWVMSTCSVIDGSKFSQSLADFGAYRRHFNSVMKKNGLPLLKNTVTFEAESTVTNRYDYVPKDDLDDDEFYVEEPLACHLPSLSSTPQPYIPQLFRQAQPMMQQPIVQFDCKISCDVNLIVKDIMAGMTDLTLLAQKNWRKTK